MVAVTVEWTTPTVPINDPTHADSESVAVTSVFVSMVNVPWAARVAVLPNLTVAANAAVPSPRVVALTIPLPVSDPRPPVFTLLEPG